MMKTSLTGLMAANKGLGVISENLANAQTTGFKRSMAQFSDLMMSDPATMSAAQFGQGTINSNIKRSSTQGSMEQTNSTLDIAIAGGGFFAYGDSTQTTPGAITPTYSRAGQLTVDPSGNLVDQSGAPILGYASTSGNSGTASNPQMINVFSKTGGDSTKVQSIAISTAGVVNVVTTDGTSIPVATIAIAHFQNEDGLKSSTGTRLNETTSSGTAEYGIEGQGDFGESHQATLEQANVNITNELLSMVQMQQAYNANSRALQTNSEMLRSVVETIVKS